MSAVELALPRLSQPLKLWEKLEIVVGEGTEAGHYAARIEDFINEGIVISSPIYIVGKTPLRENSDVTILVTRKDAVYQSWCRIRRFSSRGDRLYLLTPPRNVQRVQRRQFVRIEMFEDVCYAKIMPAMVWEDIEERLEWCVSISLDMSGGGLLMKVSDEVKTDDRLLLKIGFFPKLGLPQVVASICRRTFEQDGQMLAGVEFISCDRLAEHFSQEELNRLPVSLQLFDRATQNRLVNYIFQQQIELRKKGLL